MFDTTIVLASQGTQLATDSSHFTLRSSGRRIGRIPPTMIGQVIIHHGIEVSHTALERLGTLGIPTTFLNREGRVRSRLCPPWKHDAAPRIEQSRVFLDPAARLQVARRLVDAKIANSAAVLTRHSSNHPDPALNSAASQLHKFRRQAHASDDNEKLMGYEGAAARLYFSVFSKMLRPLWATFQGRSRRPPLDPVNALLSYTYAILTHQMLARLEGVGLDPYIGFLHRVEARRPSLALDLIEPFRPILADRLCLRLINLNVLRPEHFEDRKPQPGIYLNTDGRRAVLEAVVSWGDQCDETLGESHPSPQGLLTREVDRFAKAARDQSLTGFQPYYLIPKDQPHA
jgi:CRISPR-associated protein Cas1